MSDYLFGIDLGGTKIECAVIDPEDFEQPISRLRIPTEADLGYEHILDQIQKVLERTLEESGLPRPERIGIGTPGVLDPDTRVMKGSNTTCLLGKPMKDDLEARTGSELVMANDANCFALAEAHFGCARDYETVFGVILGTGVGGATVVNKRVLHGRHYIAGEWGQIVIDPNGPMSNYGTRGTVEAHICGPALERFYAAESGEKRDLREIVSRAPEDAAAEATIDRLTHVFAKSIAIIINVLDPHAIVLGGGVGNIDALYSEKTRSLITEQIFNARFNGALLKPQLGDSAGVFGAAMLLI